MGYLRGWFISIKLKAESLRGKVLGNCGGIIVQLLGMSSKNCENGGGARFFIAHV